MPRDFDQIAAAAAHVQASQVADETTSLPPGYIEGFEPTLNPDYTVNIKAGVAYIAGRAVKMENDHLLAGEDWVAPRLDHPNHYYIYLDKGGSFRVDLVPPVYNSGYAYYEQPDFGWRAIAKIFLKNNNIIYCSSEIVATGSTVTVAPDGYTGQADYYCTGTNDEIFINAAILYVYTASGGGTVYLKEGTFECVGQIDFLYSKISLIGSGKRTILNLGSGQGIYGSGSILSGVSISNMTLDHTDAVTTLKYAIYLDGFSDVTISDITILSPIRGIWITSNCSDVKISGCLIDGQQINKNLAQSGIYSDAVRTTVTNNTVKGLRGDFNVTGIYNGANAARSIISQNHIQDFSTTAFSSKGINVQSDYSIVSENRIESLKQSSTATNVNAIEIIAGSVSVKVTGNVCYNNGSDTGIANTNGNNFSDLGTDTQTYSNSWQTPVSGEPAQGELHWLPQSTNTTVNYWVSGGTTTAAWVSFSTGLPVGSKSAYATVLVSISSSAAGLCRHRVHFSNDYSATPAIGSNHPSIALSDYAGGAGELYMTQLPCILPLDANRKCYYYTTSRVNGTSCLVYVWGSGYNS